MIKLYVSFFALHLYGKRSMKSIDLLPFDIKEQKNIRYFDYCQAPRSIYFVFTALKIRISSDEAETVRILRGLV